MSSLKHAEDLYFFRFACQEEQTIRGLPSDNTAFPFPSQAKWIEEEGGYEQFIIEISIVYLLPAGVNMNLGKTLKDNKNGSLFFLYLIKSDSKSLPPQSKRFLGSSKDLGP